MDSRWIEAKAAADRGRQGAATDLSRAAADYAMQGAYMRAACYYGAAARIAPAGLQHDYRAAADQMEREAARLLSDSFFSAKAAAAYEIATAAQEAAQEGQFQTAAALWRAAYIAAPEALAAPGWQRESTAATATATATMKDSNNG